MTYNEVRSVAKNTPGVKAKGKKADLISAISQATTLPSAAPPSLAAIDITAFSLETLKVCYDPIEDYGG